MHARSGRLLRAHVNSRAYIVHIYDITAIPQMNPVGSGMTVVKVPSNQGVLGQGILGQGVSSGTVSSVAIII